MTSVVESFAPFAPFAVVASLVARETATVAEPSAMDAAEAATASTKAATHMATAESSTHRPAEATTHMATAEAAAAMAAAKATAAAPAKAAAAAVAAPASAAASAPAPASASASAGETIGRHDADGESGNRRRDDHHLVQHDMLLATRGTRPLPQVWFTTGPPRMRSLDTRVGLHRLTSGSVAAASAILLVFSIIALIALRSSDAWSILRL
jgi:hypothetical protein